MESGKTSVVKVRNILLVSIDDNMDDDTMAGLQDQVLNKVTRFNPSGVVFDLSAVAFVDSYFARLLTETVKMISLMGTRTVMAGMSPSIAITTTDLGLEIGEATTALNIDRALEILNKNQTDG